MNDKYFMISDGTYCHILPDKVVLGQKAVLEDVQPMSHGNRRLFFGLMGLFLVLLATGFTVLYLTNRMVMEVWIFVLMIAAGGIFRLYLFRDTSDALTIDRKSIRGTRLVKRYMGYTTWVIFFTTEKGEKLRRLVNIYDTKEHEEKAERIIREEGLLQS